MSIPKKINKIYINHSMELPLMLDNDLQKVHDSWKNLNPDYIIQYWSGKDCEKYLLENFPKIYYQTFKTLIPYAYKCDFFRYCLIYKEGGWYTDWKQELLLPLDEINKCNKNIVVFWDDGNPFSRQNNCICDGFFGSIANNKILKTVIDLIINNVKINYYGNSPLDPTGPYAFGKAFKLNDDSENIFFGCYNGTHFTIDNINVIKHKYDDRRCQHDIYINQNWDDGNNYNHLWLNKNIYNVN